MVRLSWLAASICRGGFRDALGAYLGPGGAYNLVNASCTWSIRRRPRNALDQKAPDRVYFASIEPPAMKTA
jgi:hypothetical protein